LKIVLVMGHVITCINMKVDNERITETTGS
jgi:hypothetical protein